MLHKRDKGVNNAACPPEGDPAEAGGPLRPQVCLRWTVPVGVKANCKLMP